MLSYQHAYHAGNFADVLKHSVVVEVLEYLARKEKPFHYIDTHAGAGLYDLGSASATKLEESANGIERLTTSDWRELSTYLSIIGRFNNEGSKLYPGSPLIAAQLMRTHDRAWLYELHPAQAKLLKENTQSHRGFKVEQQDGFAGLLSKVPPLGGRGFVLIDPPYEVKSDYGNVVETIKKAHKKFSSGIYALWYPVVERKKIDKMESGFLASGIRDIQLFELAVKADSTERGMTGSGMIVVNPPWGLREKMARLLPALVSTLGQSQGAFFRNAVIVAE